MTTVSNYFTLHLQSTQQISAASPLRFVTLFSVGNIVPPSLFVASANWICAIRKYKAS